MLKKLFIFLAVIVCTVFMCEYDFILSILFILVSPFVLRFFKHTHKHGNFLSINFYAQSSKLNSINSNIKIFFAIIMLIFCVGANSIIISLEIAVIMLYITVFKGKIKIDYYFSLLTLPFSFIILSSIAILFNISDKPLGYINISIFNYFICITKKSEYSAMLLITKAVGALSCLYMLSLSTPINEIISVLNKLKIPSVVVELMYLIYRYIFILLNIQNNMAIAAKSRLGNLGLKSKYYTFLSIASNLLILSLKKSSTFFDAMEARCYEGNLCFLEEQKPICKKDILIFSGLSLIIFISFIVYKILGVDF